MDVCVGVGLHAVFTAVKRKPPYEGCGVQDEPSELENEPMAIPNPELGDWSDTPLDMRCQLTGLRVYTTSE